MSEADAVDRAPTPRTRESIAGDLISLGLPEGAAVLVHSSLSSLGWVCGGPVAVIQALMDVIGPNGTLVMPTHSADYSNPQEWRNPPVPEDWWQTIKDTMPAYQPDITPTRGVGVIPETFRKWPGVLRSAHPTGSFAAWGQHAEIVVADHGLEYMFGDDSPIGTLYDMGGWVLLLGVGYGRNTSFHLAEYQVSEPPPYQGEAPVLVEGSRVWKTYRDVDFNDDVFPDIGAAFDKSDAVKEGPVGSATARLFPIREAVDFAVDWLNKNS